MRGVPLDWDHDRTRSFLAEHYGSADPAIKSLAPEIYGQSGTGYALGLDSRRIETSNFGLARVIYNEPEQHSLIDRAVDMMEKRFSELISNKDDSIDLIAMTTQAGSICATGLLGLSARFKHRSFLNEKEWRLVRITASIPKAPAPSSARYRWPPSTRSGRPFNTPAASAPALTPPPGAPS